MQRLFVVLLVLVTLAGCASAPTNPLSNVSNLSEKNLGEVVTLVYERKPEYVKLDETEKLWHWRANWATLNTDYSWIIKGTNERFQFFESYCSARNGTLEGPKVYGSVANKSAKEISCSDSKTKRPIFRVIASYNTIDRSINQIREVGGCVWLSSNQPGYDEHKTLACSETIDAFQWKSSGSLDDLEHDYRLGHVGLSTVQAVLAEEQRQLQAEREAQAKLAQIQRDIEQRNLEQAARERERAMRDLPQVKTVGQKICRTIGITRRKVIGDYRGEPIYGEPTNAKVKVTAFTESVSGDKIQVRISGMQAGNENLDRIDGDVVFQNGGVIWDNATNWGLCY